MSGDFAGFISYSRRASAQLAADLQTGVERFAKPWYQLRAVRIFRDDATMSANTALWPAIESALVSAEWLILLTSPAAAASQWVGNEVRWWLEHKSAERIVIVLEEGPDLVWDSAADDFDWPNTANLPPALRGAFAEEPRWIDLRWYEQKGSLRKADARWAERVADVAAAVRFAERDQLIGDNVREHKRALRLLRAGIVGLSLLLVASLVATVIAVLQGREADRQADIARAQEREATRQATIALARQLAAQADALAGTDLRTASLLAVQAFRTHDDAQTRATLFQMATASPQLVRTLPVGSLVETVAATPDGVVFTASADGRVLRWDGPDATELIRADGPVSSIAASDDGSVVLVVAGESAEASDVVLVREGAAERVADAGNRPYAAVAADGTAFAVSGEAGTRVWSLTADGYQDEGRIRVGGSNVTFGDSGVAVVNGDGRWALIDLDGRTFRTGNHFFGIGGLRSVALSHDGGTLALSQGSRDYEVWRGAATYADTEPNAVAATDVSEPSGIALSADGRRLATFADGELSVARVVRKGGQAPRPLRLGGIGNANTDVIAFGGDRHLVTGSGEDALVWDVDQLFRFGREMPATVGGGGCGLCPLPRVAVSPDGSSVLVLDPDGASTVDLASGEQRPVSLPEGSVSAADWLDDGRLLAATDDGEVVVLAPGSEEAHSVGTVSVDDGVRVLTIAGDGAADGRATTLLSDGVVETIDLADGSVVARSEAIRDVPNEDLQLLLAGVAPDQSTAYLGFSPPGYAPTQLAVVDLAGGTVTTTDLPQGVVAAAYDEQSRLLVFDGSRAAVLDDGRLTDTVPAEVTDLPPVVIDAEGTIAVSGGRDGIVHLVDLTRQGAEFGTFAVPQEEASYAVSAFTPDGASLVTAIQAMPTYGLGPSVRVLSLDPDDWITAACAVAARDLTAEDWERYGVGDPPADLRCAR